jgi:hypothetical protein
MIAKMVILPATILATTSAWAAPADNRGRNSPASQTVLLQRLITNRNSSIGRVYYRNCAEARAAGVAPIRAGQPGYRPELDADSDGIACEPYRGK